MNRQVSPFAALTGAEKQIRWLEYQSIRLPYVEAKLDEAEADTAVAGEKKDAEAAKTAARPAHSPAAAAPERHQPPPEVPRIMPVSDQRSRHSQYDAVIARLKQAELQARRSSSQTAQ